MKHLPETHLISHLIADKRRERYKYALFTAKNINSSCSQYSLLVLAVHPIVDHVLFIFCSINSHILEVLLAQTTVRTLLLLLCP